MWIQYVGLLVQPKDLKQRSWLSKLPFHVNKTKELTAGRFVTKFGKHPPTWSWLCYAGLSTTASPVSFTNLYPAAFISRILDWQSSKGQCSKAMIRLGGIYQIWLQIPPQLTLPFYLHGTGAWNLLYAVFDPLSFSHGNKKISIAIPRHGQSCQPQSDVWHQFRQSNGPRSLSIKWLIMIVSIDRLINWLDNFPGERLKLVALQKEMDIGLSSKQWANFH